MYDYWKYGSIFTWINQTRFPSKSSFFGCHNSFLKKKTWRAFWVPAINQQLLQELTPSYGRSSLQFLKWTDGRFFFFATEILDETTRLWGGSGRQQKQSWNQKGQVFQGSKIGFNVCNFWWLPFPWTHLWQDRLASLPYGCPAGRSGWHEVVLHPEIFIPKRWSLCEARGRRIATHVVQSIQCSGNVSPRPPGP